MTFRLAPELVDAALGRLGLTAPSEVEGVAALVEALGQTMPTGTTTKLAAIEAGEVPPGADPATVVQRWLADPAASWSCWAVATVAAALVEEGGALRASVLGARRIGPTAPPVDIHSLLEITDGSRRWVCDPYFWVGPIAEPGGDHLRPGGWAEAFAEGPVWWTAVGSCAGRSLARYRSFTTALTPADVEALCRISVTHTGVSARRRAQLATVDGSVAATEDADGRIRLRRWRVPAGRVWGTDPEVRVLASWPEAVRGVTGLAAAATSR